MLPKADTQIPRTNDRAIKRLIVPTKRELLSTGGCGCSIKEAGNLDRIPFVRDGARVRKLKAR